MTELTIDYTLNPSGPCIGTCFTTEMYVDVINSKIKNGKNLQTSIKETIKELLNYFHTTNIKNHVSQCFFNSKRNIPKASKIISDTIEKQT